MAEPWLTDNVQVQISSLQQFAEAIGKELSTNFIPSFDAGIKPMLTIIAPMGKGGLQEGLYVGGRHDNVRAAVMAMCGDAQKGLMALQMAAMSIAAEYMSGDALSQATHEDVMDAFAPLDGNVTLQGILNGTQELPAAYQGGEEEPVVTSDQADPDRYSEFAEGSGDGGDNTSANADCDNVPDSYDQRVVADGTSGEYTIGADNDNTFDRETNRRIDVD